MNGNDDELWNNRTGRETYDDIIQRIQNFIEYWLIQRTEQNIVITSHGVWIECLLRHYNASQSSLLQRRVFNLDCISCQCYSTLENTQQQPKYKFVKLDQFELISTQYN
jgi:broad specificity phosphatase PhoE